jgi:hypothetical protein
MFFVEVSAKSNSNLYTGTSTIKIVQNNLTLSELVAQKNIGVIRVVSINNQLSLEVIREKLQRINFNTVDNVVLDGLEIISQTGQGSSFDRTVTLGVKDGSELAEIVDPLSTIIITALAINNNKIYVKVFHDSKAE